MNILLDTHTFLWMVDEVERLSAKAQDVLGNADNRLYLSSISVWEMAQKYQLKKLPLSMEPARFAQQACKRHNVTLLSFETEACGFLQPLPPVHKDPFDRMLVCQALQHNLTLVTDDKMIQKYPVTTFW